MQTPRTRSCLFLSVEGFQFGGVWEQEKGERTFFNGNISFIRKLYYLKRTSRAKNYSLPT